MTVDIKYSWFLAQKGSKRARRVAKRYGRKNGRLNQIIENSKAYGIELSLITLGQIEDKKKFYYNQSGKLNTFIWEFERNGSEKALKLLRDRYYQSENSLVNKIKNLF
jgi:hypothetical protein